MSLLPFGKLQPYRERSFLPGEVNLGDWSELEPFFDELERRAEAAADASGLEEWLMAVSELTAALDEESSGRYIAMTCHTDNDEAEKAYLQFVEEIDPKVKPRQFRLWQAYLKHPARSLLDPVRYQVFDRDTQAQVDLYREENVPLETEEAKLGQQYQKLIGSLAVVYEGEERTLPQMAPYLEDPDRAVRQEAWELVTRRRLQELDRVEQLFEQLLEVRSKIAANAGFANYRDYAFRARGRFDYGPGECVSFHEAIEEEVMPLVRRLQEERREALGVGQLRPWDLSVDVRGRPPLRPFEQVEELLGGVQRIFDRLDGDLGRQFRLMREKGLLDLENRKGKAPGGYQAALAEARAPFIFMNAVGLQRDVETMLHEAGHAFHALAAREEDLYAYRHAPIEFCEVASMTLELLGAPHLDEFFKEREDLERAQRDHLEGIIKIFPWIATVDAFQHWLYTRPGHSRSDREQAWEELMTRFGGEVDWSGWEPARNHLWHRQLHLFLHPFYYIEYGIAELGALQIWANAKRDQAGALQQYKEGLALGGSRPLPELFARAGCRFDFGAGTVGPLMRLLQEELARD